jgi:signal transduction histidine kinase
MTLLGVSVGIGALTVGTVAALLLRALRSVRLQLMGLALVTVLLPLGSVLVSGLVMFHMGNDADFIFITGLVTASGLLGAFLLARNIVAPLDVMRLASQKLAAGDLGARAPVGGPSELSELGSSFNVMATHLEEAFDARRELVAWASHDLRAPITSLQAMLEAIEDGIVEPRHYLSPLQSQVRLLGALVDDLFELACIDSGAVTLEFDAVDVEQLVESCVHRFEAEATAREVQLVAPRNRGAPPTRSNAFSPTSLPTPCDIRPEEEKSRLRSPEGRARYWYPSKIRGLGSRPKWPSGCSSHSGVLMAHAIQPAEGRGWA